MLLQTLVENGIKHGISKLKAGGEITLTANIKNKILTIVIVNDGEYKPKIGESSGTGLNNSKKRIELLYSAKSSLTIKNKNSKVYTEIKLHHLINYNESTDH